jgi:hypothetical protein
VEGLLRLPPLALLPLAQREALALSRLLRSAVRKPYLTKLWIGRRWVYVRTRRKYRLRTIRVGRRFAGIVSHARSSHR